MKCPVDDTTLSISSREGIEIDFCPQCRGVWLDRGELDKIIERTASSLVPTGDGRQQRYDDRRYDDDDDDRDKGRRRYDDDRRHDEHGRGKRKKKSSFLSELFEFGGE